MKAASVESGDDKGSLLDGRYVLLEKLGEGGRGIVYKALDNLLDRVIALKVLKGEGLDEEAYTRFMREAQAAARLSHTNVVAIYDVGEDSGRHFLVVEYVDGQTLRDLLQERRAGRLDPASLLRIAREVCRALEYAHSRGILHRDIKPENIMITRDGTAKLMDFGLARALDQPHVTPSGVMVGTPTYMSPENALGKESDARSDLYSLGAVLYEMATGQPPFPEEDSLKVIYRHIHDEPVAPSRLNPDLPVGLEELILRLLQKDPSRRYRSASDLLRVLREVEQSEGGEEVRPEEPSPPAETGETKRVPTPEPRRTLRLVDREIELERLKAYLDGVLRGDGSVVLLAGEAGIGKTRLAEELKAYATLRGARWLVGRCFEKEGIMPFAPWAQILREIVRETPRQLLYRVSEGYANELAKLVPEIIDKIGPVPSIATEDPSQERFRLFEGVTQVFLRLSQEAPLILFLDDLNWADPASLELFLYVARNVSGRFLLVVGAFRDVELEEDTALSSMLLDLNRDRLLNSIRLERLDASQVAQMIGETFGEEDVSGEFLALIFEKTGGNPFFVEEVLRSLVEVGVIYPTEEGWDRRPVSEIRIPSTVKAVVRQRLGRLGEECRHLLAMASVLGKEFEFALLQRVAAEGEEELIELLEQAIKARLIREMPSTPGQSRFAFTDSQIQDVLYEEISLVRRRRYHLKAGEAIEALHGDRLRRYSGELADHYLEGGDLKKALDHSIVAGERAFQVHAFEEAILHFRNALELMEQEEDRSRSAQVLEWLGDASSFMGRADTALKYWSQALGLYEELEEGVRAGDVCRKMGYACFMEKYEKDRAMEWYANARKILEGEPKSEELASLYHDIARLLWRNGEELSEAVTLCEEALNLAAELKVPEVESQAYQTLSFLLPTGEKEISFEYLQRALDVGLEHNCFDATSRAYGNMGLAYSTIKGDSRRAMEVYREGMEYVNRVGYFAYRDCIQAELALLGYLPQGSWAVAVGIANALRGSAVTCTLHGIIHPLVTLGLVRLYEGKWSESEGHLNAALSRMEEFKEAIFVAPYVALGRLYLERGEYAKAEENLRAAYEVLKKAGDHIQYVVQLVLPLSILTELALRKEEEENAKVYLGELSDVVHAIDEEWARAYLHRTESLMAAWESRWDAAAEGLQKSVEEWRSVGWPYELARTLYELGVMHQKRDEKEMAREPLNQALEIFSQLGAKMDIEKVLARKELLKA